VRSKAVQPREPPFCSDADGGPMKTLAVHIGMFGAARLESTPLIEWAKNILMTQQGAAGETSELLGRRPGGQRQGRRPRNTVMRAQPAVS
jgi:hypothetical protein